MKSTRFKTSIGLLLPALLFSACNLSDRETGVEQSGPGESTALAARISSTGTGSFNNELVAIDYVRSGVSAMAGDESQFYYAHGYGDNGVIYKQYNTAVKSLVSVKGGSFRLTQGMATLGNYLYVIENGYLVRVDKNSPPDGASAVRIGSQLWDKTQSMTATGTHLFLVHNDYLYKVDPNNGSYVRLGTNSWKYTGGMAFNPSEPEFIYIVENGSLNRVSISTGAFTKVGDAGIWQGCRGLAYLKGWLYLTFGKNLWRVNVANPSIREDIHRDIPTCCGSEVVRNSITASGNSIFYWAGSGFVPCDKKDNYGDDPPNILEWMVESMVDFLFDEPCGGDPRSFIVKVTPL